MLGEAEKITWKHLLSSVKKQKLIKNDSTTRMYAINCEDSSEKQKGEKTCLKINKQNL